MKLVNDKAMNSAIIGAAAVAYWMLNRCPSFTGTRSGLSSPKLDILISNNTLWPS